MHKTVLKKNRWILSQMQESFLAIYIVCLLAFGQCATDNVKSCVASQQKNRIRWRREPLMNKQGRTQSQ